MSVSPDKGCLFCRVVGGDVAAARVYEGPEAVAFLDHRPVFKGHVLVVPRSHVGTLPELPAAALGPLFRVVQRIADAVEKGLGAHGTFVALNNRISQSVPHLHVHVVPRHQKDGLRGFFWPRVKYASDDERDEIAARLRTALASTDDSL